MYLHESIIWSASSSDLSGILIHCDEAKREEISKFFDETFTRDWSDAEDAVEKEYGDCMEKDEGYGSIATVSIDDDGVLVLLGPLYLSYSNGDYIESEGFAYKALKKSLKRLINTYPEITYEGYIGYTWSDQHGGEAEQWEMSSENDSLQETKKVYPFIGKRLSVAMESENFWENMADNLDCYEADESDFKKILKIFVAYEEWLPKDCFDSLFDVADGLDDEMRPELEEYLDALRLGEVEDEEDDEFDDLPEGYMDALNAVIASENKRKNAEIDSELDGEFSDEDDE